MTNHKILILDDDKYIRLTLDQFLEQKHYEPTVAGEGKDALALLKEQSFDLFLLDVHLQEMSGMDILCQAMEIQPDLKTIVISEHPSIEEAVEAMKLGASNVICKPHDFIQKPFAPDALFKAIEEALQT